MSNSQDMAAPLRLTVPATFWDDHYDRAPCDGDRDQDMAREVRRFGSCVEIEGNAAQIECLRSDAAYYCSKDGPDQCPRSIKQSALRTLTAIAKTKGQA